jgi:transcriptional regulator GlxA family with amidase domain
LPFCTKGQYRAGHCGVRIVGMSTWPTLSIHQAAHERAFPNRTRHYRRIVARIGDAVGARMDVPVHIADLCRIATVSQRTLRNAFHVVHGMTPYRYLRAMRMGAARKALLSPDSAGLTVTQVATQFGFFELGRFAVEYRAAFGESPSATLRRESAARRPSPPRIATARPMHAACIPPP